MAIPDAGPGLRRTALDETAGLGWRPVGDCRWRRGGNCDARRRRFVVADVAYVLLTVALFALLSLAVRAVEKL